MLQRNIVFPSKIKAIALDPAEHVLYVGSEDGKIFVAALNTTRITTNDQVSYITGSFSNHRLSFHLLLSTVLNCCHPLFHDPFYFPKIWIYYFPKFDSVVNSP